LLYALQAQSGQSRDPSSDQRWFDRFVIGVFACHFHSYRDHCQKAAVNCIERFRIEESYCLRRSDLGFEIIDISFGI
jgi:hypothetical protein